MWWESSGCWARVPGADGGLWQHPACKWHTPGTHTHLPSLLLRALLLPLVLYLQAQASCLPGPSLYSPSCACGVELRLFGPASRPSVDWCKDTCSVSATVVVAHVVLTVLHSLISG